jgi:hypothetical protein
MDALEFFEKIAKPNYEEAKMSASRTGSGSLMQ